MVYTKSEPQKEPIEKKETKVYSVGDVPTQTTEMLLVNGEPITINGALALILNKLISIEKAVV